MTERDLPTGIVTFLFSDIERSTRLLQFLGRDAYAELLGEHNQVFRDVVGDATVSTEGDSFFCAFSTPREAIAAAVHVQQSLHEHQWPDGHEVRVRMGVHTGEGVRGGDNYVGLDVHRAARISAAAHGGQVLLSDATRSQVEHLMPEGSALRDLGIHQLKDLANAEHIYQVVISGLRNDFPPPNSVEIGPANLPEHLSSFVGRKAELVAVARLLAESRLVTLTGTGGAGKTRLAIEAGRVARSQHLGGVFFTALAKLEDAEFLASHVAAELSIPEQVGGSINATLIDYFQPRQALLILDNCEHVADAAAALAEGLLRACLGLTVLATSREALLIAGEHIYEVGPMTLAADDGVHDSDAVALFTARAAEVAPGFDASRWAKECSEICARLDGIPLAIELAAARSGMLAPPDILAHLEDRFGFLKGRSRTGSARHETLEAAIDWSYDLLDEASKRLLRSLAIFRGGFTIDAAGEVCFDGAGGEGLILDQLTELRDKSLLTHEVTFAGTRFGLLETIRDYASLRLHEEGEFEAVARRHREYFTGLARGQSHRLSGAEQLEALEVLEADHDNFRAVMRRALDEDDTEAAADMAGWLVWFWYIHAHFTEGERWAGRLLDALPEDPARPWLRLLLGAAQYDFRIGNYDRADARLHVASQAADAQNVPRLQMWAHAYLASNELYRMDLEVARREAEQAMAVASDLGDFIGLAYATYLLVLVGAAAAESGGNLEPKRAAELLERLAPVSAGVRATSERNMIGHVLQLEGTLSSRVGDHKRAAAAFDEAVTAFSELGTVGCASHCLEAVAEYAASSGRHEAAARLIGATDSLRSAVGIIVAPAEERSRTHAISMFTSALSEAARSAETEAGSALSLAEAAQLARQTLAQG